MKEYSPDPSSLTASFQKIQTDLRDFIELSLREDEQSWGDWIALAGSTVEAKCWEIKHCEQLECPAYMNPCGRCWIIAGTMCAGEPEGLFAKKYLSCRECDVYQGAVYSDMATEIKEHLIVLVHSLRCKNQLLKQVAITDHLTKVYNRRYFDQYITHEHSRLKRNNAELTILIIDINKFKKLNDTCGHLQGDIFLRDCARILLHSTRESDAVFRFGGDEFVVVLHEVRGEILGVDQVIDRIEENISLWNRCDNSTPFPMSLSYGHATLTGEDRVDEVLSLADRRMYVDKRKKASPGDGSG